MNRAKWTVAAVLCLAALARPQSPAELLEKISRLERDAAARDQKIAELERGLSERHAAEDAARLETAINALTSDDAPAAVVAPKSLGIVLGGQVRIRSEYRTVKNYGAGVDDDEDFVLQRTRLHVDADVLDDVRVFVQLQDSRTWGEETNPLGDLEGVDIHQAFVDFKKVFDRVWTFRVGRQELLYGDQRLVSPLDWSAIGRSFDGVRTWYEGEGWQLDLFVMNIDENSLPTGGKSDDDRIFDGLYFHYTGLEKHEIDAYIFHRAFSDGTFTSEGGAAGDLEDATFGIRFKGATDGFSYSAEGDYQIGDRAGDDIGAYAWALTFAYTFDHDWKPTIGVEWDFASGDDDAADGDFGTFDPLFPFGHSYQGYLDVFAWRNSHDFVLRANVKPDEDYWVEAAVHYFMLDSDTDAWFNAAGLPIRRFAAGGVDNTIGWEIDLHCKYQLNRATALWFGYSHFFAGGYVDDTGDDPDADWLWFQMTVTF